jgi:adenylate cyclase
MIFLKRTFVLIFLFSLTLSISSQNVQLIDSLQAQLNIVNDSLKPGLYNDISWEYRNSDIPKCIANARKASEIAMRYDLRKEHIRAISFIGVAYRNIGDFPMALEYYFESLKQSEEIGDKEQIAYSLNNIGNIYIYQENYEEAKRYILRTLEIAKELNNNKILAYCYINLGRIYKNTKDYEKSLNYLFKTLEIRKGLNDLQSVGNALYDIAETYMTMGSLNKALDYFNESIEILSQVGDKDGKAFCYNNVAKIYLKKNQFDKALKYAKEGLEISSVIGLKYEEKKSHYTLSEIYAANEQYQYAFKYLKKYIDVKDSIFNQESVNKMAQYQVKAELEKQEAQIELLIKDKKLEEQKAQQNKLFLIFSLIVLVVVIAIMLFVYRNYREKKKINQILRDQKEEIEAQRDTIDDERKKSDELLLNILPEETANELKEKGSAATKLHKNVTVMFADLIDFSSKSEKINPEKLIGDLNKCFIQFDEITAKYGVEKIKTIGDAYMCAGGIHNERNSTINTIKAAVEMQAFMNNWKKESIAKNEPFWEMRIGIHTGQVIGGVIGKKKFSYDIWGNTVNIASRLESASEAGKINVSGETFELIKNQVECKYRGKVAAKNLGDIDMYFIQF